MLARVKFFALVFQLLLAANGQKIKKEMSLSGPYIQEEILKNWDVTGEAESETSILRLTSAKPDVSGGIWSKHPNLSNKWEVQMNFRINGEGLQAGEGIAIWYVRDSMMPGPIFGSRDYFSGLGIFIDSVLDQDDEVGLPYIYGIINNGSQRFLDSLRIGGCHAAVRNIMHWTKIAVSYSGNSLTVFLDNEGKNKWKLCFISQGVHLPTAYRLGVTASTTEFSEELYERFLHLYSKKNKILKMLKIKDRHEIISLTTLDLDDPNKLWEDRSDIIPFAENVLMPIHPSKEDLLDDGEGFEVDDEENEIEKSRKEEIEEKLKEIRRKEAEDRHKREEMEKQEKLLREKQQKEEKERMEREEKERLQKELQERRKKEEKERQEKDEKEKQMKAQKEAKEKLRKEKGKEEKPVEEETPPVPFIRKAIYILGTLLILVIIIKVYKKYSTRRREAQHKRLY